MVRIARIVAPGLPHHVTQRGNRRQATFFCEEDDEAYLHLMSEWCSRWNVEVWAYCVMPNHVHMIAVPVSGEGNGLVRVKPLRDMVGNWRDFLLSGVFGDERGRIRRHERTGRPWGMTGLLQRLNRHWVVSYTARSHGGKRG